MRQKPHALDFREELKVPLPQPHPGTDDIKDQVAFQQIRQDLGQMLGNGRVAALAVPQLQALGQPGDGEGEEHIL